MKTLHFMNISLEEGFWGANLCKISLESRRSTFETQRNLKVKFFMLLRSLTLSKFCNLQDKEGVFSIF